MNSKCNQRVFFLWLVLFAICPGCLQREKQGSLAKTIEVDLQELAEGYPQLKARLAALKGTERVDLSQLKGLVFYKPRKEFVPQAIEAMQSSGAREVFVVELVSGGESGSWDYRIEAFAIKKEAVTIFSARQEIRGIKGVEDPKFVETVHEALTPELATAIATAAQAMSRLREWESPKGIRCGGCPFFIFTYLNLDQGVHREMAFANLDELSLRNKLELQRGLDATQFEFISQIVTLLKIPPLTR